MSPNTVFGLPLCSSLDILRSIHLREAFSGFINQLLAYREHNYHIILHSINAPDYFWQSQVVKLSYFMAINLNISFVVTITVLTGKSRRQ